MTQALFILAVSVWIEILSPIPLLALLIGLGLALRLKGVPKSWVMILWLVFAVRLKMELPVLTSPTGRIVELNAATVVVTSGNAKVMVSGLDPLRFSIGDVITFSEVEALNETSSFYGFDDVSWAKANGIIGIADYASTIRKAPTFLRWLSFENQTPNSIQALWRSFFFQVHDEGSALILSLGLHFAFLMSLVEWVLLKINGSKLVWIVQSALTMVLGWGLGWPLALMRIWIFMITSKLIQDRISRWSTRVLLLGLVEPFGLTQLAWVLPLMLDLQSLFGPRRHKKTQAYLMLVALMHAFNIRTTYLRLLLFPWVRRLYPFLLAGLLMIRTFSWLQRPSLVLIQGFNDLMGSLDGFGIISGRMTLLASVVLLLWFALAKRIKSSLWLVGMCLILAGLNPILLLPWLDQVTFINVGQGDAILIQLAFNRQVILIDTGSSRNHRALQSLLDGLGLKHIDRLIVTHADEDHSGNVDFLMDAYAVQTVQTTAESFAVGGLEMLALENPDAQSENDASLVYRMKLDEVTFMLAADISNIAERALMKQGIDLTVDVLKVAHHGSSSSSSNAFLSALRARIAVLSVGKNTYGHPHYSVVKRLENYGYEILSTQNDGDLRFVLREGTIWIQTSRGRILRLAP